MELLLILLKNGRHNPEDAVGAALAALAFTLIFGIVSRIKSKKKNMDEVSKDGKKDDSDW